MTSSIAVNKLDLSNLEELFKKIDNRKKLEEVLMDPRVIELSRTSPQSRQLLAAIVQKLKEERDRKRRVRSSETKEELAGIAKWFDCINFMKPLMLRPEVSRSKRSITQQRNKMTVSAPNLDSARKPDIPPSEGDFRLPRNNVDLKVMEFCSTQNGGAMFSSIFNFKDIFRMKSSTLNTRRQQIVLYCDPSGNSDVKYMQLHVLPTKLELMIFILKPFRKGDFIMSYHSQTESLYETAKSLVTSATQTMLSGSCSFCNANCRSTETYPTFNEETSRIFNSKYKKTDEATEELDKDDSEYFKIPTTHYLDQFYLSDKKKCTKASKSQSDMYATVCSECENFSIDETLDGRYLSKILTNVEAPSPHFLTTPDVLVTYSDGPRGSDSEYSGSCEACKQLGRFSSESSVLSEIWTQKRMKTSCESCITSFRTEFIQKAKNYCGEIDRYGSSSSEETFSGSEEYEQRIPIDQCKGEKMESVACTTYKSAQNTFDENVSKIMPEMTQKSDENNKENEFVIIKKEIPDVTVVSAIHESIIPNTSMIEFNDKELNVETVPSEIQDTTVNPSESMMTVTEKTDDSVSVCGQNIETEIKIWDREVQTNAEEFEKPYAGKLPDAGVLNTMMARSSSDSTDEKTGSSTFTRFRKRRRRTKSKFGSIGSISNSSSTSSEPREPPPSQREQNKPVPAIRPNLPPQKVSHGKVLTKQPKPKSKNCVVM